MGINYDPQEASKNCWPIGDYDAVLQTVEDGISKNSGADMEIWQIGCYHPDGREQTIKEYVTASAAFKIKQLATALGKKSDFEAGTFHAEDYIGASFAVALSIEESDGYDDKNKVARFKSRSVRSAPSAPARPPTRAPASIAQGVREKVSARPAPSQPFGEEQAFKEADIPF